MVEKDYQEIGQKTIFDTFNIKVAEVTSKFAKLFKPFDAQCARLEFRDKYDAAERESERRMGFVKQEDIKLEIGNLDKYADEDRFEFIEKKQETEFIIVNGIRTSAPSGYTMNYRCKARGHGISVFIPMDDYSKLKEKK